MSSLCRSAGRGALGLFLIASLGLVACRGGDAPATRQPPPSGDRAEGVRQVRLRPGQPAAPLTTAANPLGSGPAVLQDGERLYNWMNCVGCHFNGGGGIGPPLMDDQWIYGGSPAQIFDSIVNGRANGMPAYGDRLVVDEIWRIVAYVESLNPERAADGAGSSGGPSDGGGRGR